MRSKTKEEIAECVAILNQTGGEDALKQRITVVKNGINNLESEAESYERKRSQILADMECVETYTYEAKKIERNVIELTWDWYPRGKK